MRYDVVPAGRRSSRTVVASPHPEQVAAPGSAVLQCACSLSRHRSVCPPQVVAQSVSESCSRNGSVPSPCHGTTACLLSPSMIDDPMHRSGFEDNHRCLIASDLTNQLLASGSIGLAVPWGSALKAWNNGSAEFPASPRSLVKADSFDRSVAVIFGF